MITLAKFSIRRPRVALLGWLLVAAALSAIGLGAANSISPSVTTTKGTESYRAQQLAEQKFGPTQLIPILLEGPKGQLNTVGPTLVRAIVARPNTRALSAWDAGSASAGLRPSATAAMILVSVDRSEKDTVKTDLPALQRLVTRDVHAPVHAYVSGQPTIDQALKNTAISSLHTAALIAIGILFLLLLAGLRAPLAAVLITVLTGAATLSAFGIMALLGRGLTVDAVAVATGGIAGLTRSSTFALMMLDRFHHEEGKDHAHAVRSAVELTVGRTGRTVLYAGSVMVLALLLTDLFGPVDVLASLGIGAVLCTLFATGAAVVVLPAALMLLGPAISQERLRAPRPLEGAWNRLVEWGTPVVRHPGAVGSLAAAGLLLLAVPAFAVTSGPQDVRQLPPGNQARVAFNEIARVMGPGWPTPYDVIVSNPNGPITTATLLSALTKYQTSVAQDPAVASVMGPAAINANAKQLQAFKPSLDHSATISEQSKKQLLELINGLGQAGAGSAQLQAGLKQASSGATQLHSGSGSAQSGAGQLHAGLVQAKSGSTQLQTGLNQALSGAIALQNGASQALAGSNALTAGLSEAAGPVKAGLPAVGQLASASASALRETTSASGSSGTAAAAVANALSELRSVSGATSDPHYAAALADLARADGALGALTTPLGQAVKDAGTAAFLAAGVDAQVTKLAPGLAQLRAGAAQLSTGIAQLRDGNTQLSTGIQQLAGGGTQLSSGLSQLTAGAGALQTGLGQLTSGTGQLAQGLISGVAPAGQLITGLGTMQAAVIKARGQIPSTAQLHQLEQQSPGLFSSGYFVLAAVAGAQASDRNAATFTINVLRGGDTAQIVVTGRYAVSDGRAEQLGRRLQSLTARFARTNHLNAAIGGPAGSLFDVSRTASDKLLAVIIGTALGCALLLAIMLRSILIPAVATLIAAVTTASAFGLMQLLFGGSSPILGGPGTFDPVSEIEIASAIFGAAVVFLVVLLDRTREYYAAEGNPRGSVRRAMRSTIASTSGMAAISIATLIPFVVTELQPIRRIAMAGLLAIVLVAYVVVPVILPAAVSLLGRAGWWPTHGPEEPDRDGERASRRRRRLIPVRPAQP